MTEENRRPGSVWSLYRPGRYPNGYVRTEPGDRIEVIYTNREGDAEGFSLSRADARMLARRLNECLDATVKS